MKTFNSVLKKEFKLTEGYYSFKFGDGYELTFEPFLFDEQYYICLYQNQEQLIEKIIIKPGK